MDGEQDGTMSGSAWAERRRSQAFQSQTGLFVGVGVVLAFLGVVLGMGKAVQRSSCPGRWAGCSRYPDFLDGSLVMLAFVLLGILVVLAGRILDAIHLRVDR
jgi:hypothetical protein